MRIGAITDGWQVQLNQRVNPMGQPLAPVPRVPALTRREDSVSISAAGREYLAQNAAGANAAAAPQNPAQTPAAAETTAGTANYGYPAQPAFQRLDMRV